MVSTTIIPNIDIIITLYFHKVSLYPIIRECFMTLEKYYPEFNKIVVDDASPLPHDFPVTIRNKENLGYTKSVNKGLEKSTAPIIIVANDDLSFKKGDLDKFKLIDSIGIFSPRDSASGDLESFGAIFGMTRETYKIMGNMDEKYRNFYSDRAYLDRANSLGVPVVKWTDICITHHESATFNLLDKKTLLEEDSNLY